MTDSTKGVDCIFSFFDYKDLKVELPNNTTLHVKSLVNVAKVFFTSNDGKITQVPQSLEVWDMVNNVPLLSDDNTAFYLEWRGSYAFMYENNLVFKVVPQRQWQVSFCD